jgi:hypothetical protein
MTLRRVTLIAVVTVSILWSSASAQASTGGHPALPLRSEAHAAVAIPQFLKNIARRFWQSPPVRIARRFTKREIKSSVRDWLISGGTDCQFPLPESFCSWRPRLGLGQAVSYYGRAPGVWNRPSSPRYEVSQPLVPGRVYYLYCWQYGESIRGPLGTTSLWYRVSNGGYVSDAFLYTGTNSAIPGVRRC